eukprot:scaffold82503_cov88-Phaeocystis_antarctica.AAC.2
MGPQPGGHGVAASAADCRRLQASSAQAAERTTSSESTVPVLVTCTAYCMAGPAAATAFIDGKAGPCEVAERGGSSGARGAREMARGASATE